MSPRAFVSSTYEDLKDHRAHVIRALRQAGFTVDPMEDWRADADEPGRTPPPLDSRRHRATTPADPP